MAILAECDICGNQHRVKDALAGSSIHCKECGALFPVPRDQLITPTAFVEEDGRLRRRQPAPPGNQWAWFIVGAATLIVSLSLGAAVWALITLNSVPLKGAVSHQARSSTSLGGIAR